jgi:HD-GYP domain-containing protein (c-di-GMP phosphodiesterase class II)
LNEPACHPELLEQQADLSATLRRAGMLVMGCDARGELVATADDRDWLGDLCHRSPLFRRAVRDVAGCWRQEDQPTETEVTAGLWVVPLPVVVRRRRIGYSLVVIPTTPLVEDEPLAAICQSAPLDPTSIRGRLTDLPPVAPEDLQRLVTLVRSTADDQLRIRADRQACESFGKQLAESYEEINLLYTIIQSMNEVDRPRRFIEMACQGILDTLPFRWIAVQFRNDRQQLKRLAGQFIVAGDPDCPSFHLRTMAGRLLDRVSPNEPEVIEPSRNTEDAAFAGLGRTAIVHPVSRDNRVIGVIIAGDKQGEDEAASSVDTKLIGATATNMAIFLENAALYDDLNAMFMGTLEALTASIDAKDRYTCGHSLRVASLTQQLARRAGLDDHTIGRMRVAGLVHDVGKIGVPESVLLKPGALTSEEFDWIKLHPEMGYRILKDIPQLNDILPGVLYHHERWDGGGYPKGLAGEEIPLMARIIALADAFDAMSSNRTYREARSRREVLTEITQNAGRQFDPSLAPLFVTLDFQEYDLQVREHKAGDIVTPLHPGEAA